MNISPKIFFILIFIFVSGLSVGAQNLTREFSLKSGGAVEIKNLYGRVEIVALAAEENGDAKVLLQSQTAESDLQIDATGEKVSIEVAPKNKSSRVDLSLKIPERARLKVETGEGEVKFSGSFQTVEVSSETGTIAADVPLENLRYSFVWTASRPRFMSERELGEVREKAAGRFQVKGKIEETETVSNNEPTQNEEVPTDENAEEPTETKNQKPRTKNQKPKTKPSDNRIELDLTTARGIILLNVNPNSVPTNLVERPLTEAAKAIIRSGDSLLTEAIRRASPKYFGDYARTLPPSRREPVLNERTESQKVVFSEVKKVLARVTDLNNRAVSNLKKEDFEVSETGREREVLSVEPATAPFNLVLLLDVSGSIDNYVDFIRKTARDFVNVVSPQDKVSIITFNEDVKTLSTFSLNKNKLSESLDTFDSGGATAYYDALAYTLVDTLEPLKGDRTAIVVLSDGDDNRSFLSFDSLLGTIQESGALVYPLYVPSGLVAASATKDPNQAIDPLRTRFLSLTSKAEIEGEKLAQVSGGVYYPISQLGQLRKAFEDIVNQLRTAYTITFRSDLTENRDGRASPRLRVRVKKENTFVRLGSVVEVRGKTVSVNNSGGEFAPVSFSGSVFFLR